MRLQFNQSVLFVGVLSVVCQGAWGQSLTSRYSQLNYNYVYGAGGDSHVGNDNIEDNVLLVGDSEQTGYSGGTSGVLPGDPVRPYSASVACQIEHEYSIIGSLTAAQSIIASGFTEVSSLSSGAGTALMNSSNNGNHLMFYFTVDHVVEYRLAGAITSTEPSFATAVALQRFDGITWQYVFYTVFMPGGQGSFDVSGTLNSGDYRISANIALNTFANESQTGSYNYALTLSTEGDMNCDGLVNGLDVQGFVLAVLDPVAYDATYSDCNYLNGDMNDDTFVTVDDISGLVDSMTE